MHGLPHNGTDDGHYHMKRTAYTAIIASTAKDLGLDADLLEAQVLVESSGIPTAFRYEAAYYRQYIIGNSGARGNVYGYGPLAACSYGLLQIMLEMALEIGYTAHPWALFEPEIGLHWGSRYFAGLRDWASGGGVGVSDVRALAAYNGGKVGNVTPPYRNQAYADKVFSVRDQLVKP